MTTARTFCDPRVMLTPPQAVPLPSESGPRIDLGTLNPGRYDTGAADFAGCNVAEVGVDDGEVSVHTRPDRPRYVLNAIDPGAAKGVGGEEGG